MNEPIKITALSQSLNDLRKQNSILEETSFIIQANLGRIHYKDEVVLDKSKSVGGIENKPAESFIEQINEEIEIMASHNERLQRIISHLKTII